MADLKYLVEVDTKGAQRSISGLKSSIAAAGAALAAAFSIKEIANTSARFEDLRITLGILYKDVATGAKAFDEIKKFAAESVFSVENLTNTVVKLKAAGLEPTIKQLRLFADVSSVSADSVGALQAITDLYARTTAGGLGLEDLNRLADRGIPVFTILSERLGKNRLELSKLGQTAEGSGKILSALEDGLEDAFGGASAARTQSLSQAFSNFGDAVDNAFDAIGQAGLNQALGDATRSITAFISENEELIKSIGEGLGTAITLVVDNIKFLITLMSAAFAGAIAAKVVTVVVAVYKLATAFKAAAVAGTILQGVTGIGLVKVAAGLAAAAGAVLTINKLTEDAGESVGGLNDEIDKLNNSDGGISGPLSSGAANEVDTYAEALKAVLAPHQRFIDQAKKFSEADYRTDLEKANQSVVDAQIVIEQLHLAFKRSNGQVENFVFLLRGADRELERATAAVKELTDANRELTKDERFTEFFKELTEGAAEQVEQLEFNKRAITALKDAYAAGTITLAAYTTAMSEVDESVNKSAESIRALSETSADFQRDIAESTADAKRDLEQLNMNALEKQLDDINHNLSSDLADTVRELNSAALLNPELAGQYATEIANITTATNAAITAQQQLAEEGYVNSRTFASGWKKAYSEYADEATNASKTAEKMFNKTTQSMEDSIVSFAKTGKFEFKDLINTILEELLRSQIQRLIAQTFGSFGGGGGGGFNPFAGFFANGGLIPSGKFGVVGENGPELVSGPANITPMNGLGGGSSQVIYNINAVDAPSFKAMIARDPGFIHAVAQQGARKVPVRR